MVSNSKHLKYRYLGRVSLCLPEYWKPIVLNLYKDLDKQIRPWYIPRFVCNYLSDKNSFYILSITRDNFITQVKDKFATLCVYGTFDDQCQKIVNSYRVKCNNTCEYCGVDKDTRHVGIKGWVRNLCPDCIIKLKNNESDNGGNSSITECTR